MTQIKVDWRPAGELINPSYELYSFFADNMDGKQFAIRLKAGRIKCGVRISCHYVPSDSFEDDKEWCVKQGEMHEPISFMTDSYSYYPSEITHYAPLDITPPEGE